MLPTFHLDQQRDRSVGPAEEHSSPERFRVVKCRPNDIISVALEIGHPSLLMDHQISTPAIPWWCQIWCSTNHQPFLHQSLQLSAAEWIPHPAAILSSETKSFVPTKPLSKISILLLLEPATVPTTNDRERRRNNRMTQLWFHKETYKSDSAVSALLHLQVRTSYMVQRKPIVENSCSPSTFTNLPPQQMDAKVRQLPLATSTMAVKMGIQILLMHTNPSIENHIKPAHSAWQQAFS